MQSNLSRVQKLYIERIKKLAEGAKMHLEWAEKDIRFNGDVESYNESYHWYNVNIQKIKKIIDEEFEKSSLVPSHSKEYFLKSCLEAAGEFYGNNIPEFPKRNLNI